MRFTRISFMLVASLAAACSSDGGGTAPAPVIVAPTISTPNTMIYIGQSVQFSATGGGTIRWGGDAPQVATVDQTTGRVTGVGTGRVTIWAENEGGRTTRLLRGLPSYAGSWRGNYTIQDCQSIGDFAAGGFCGSFFRGQSLNTRYELSQTDDRVTGPFALGDLTGTFNPSTVAENGQLPMTGGLSSGGTSVTIENLRFESATPGVITGQFEQLCQVAFAGAGRAEEKDVLALGDEARGGELVDERAIHLLVEIEIKGVERALGVTEACELVSAFEQAVLPAAEFVGHQRGHQVEGRQLLGLPCRSRVSKTAAIPESRSCRSARSSSTRFMACLLCDR